MSINLSIAEHGHKRVFTDTARKISLTVKIRSDIIGGISYSYYFVSGQNGHIVNAGNFPGDFPIEYKYVFLLEAFNKTKDIRYLGNLIKALNDLST